MKLTRRSDATEKMRSRVVGWDPLWRHSSGKRASDWTLKSGARGTVIEPKSAGAIAVSGRSKIGSSRGARTRWDLMAFHLCHFFFPNIHVMNNKSFNRSMLLISKFIRFHSFTGIFFWMDFFLSVEDGGMWNAAEIGAAYRRFSNWIN